MSLTYVKKKYFSSNTAFYQFSEVFLEMLVVLSSSFAWSFEMVLVLSSCDLCYVPVCEQSVDIPAAHILISAKSTASAPAPMTFTVL